MYYNLRRSRSPAGHGSHVTTAEAGSPQDPGSASQLSAPAAKTWRPSLVLVPRTALISSVRRLSARMQCLAAARKFVELGPVSVTLPSPGDDCPSSAVGYLQFCIIVRLLGKDA